MKNFFVYESDGRGARRKISPEAGFSNEAGACGYAMVQASSTWNNSSIYLVISDHGEFVADYWGGGLTAVEEWAADAPMPTRRRTARKTHRRSGGPRRGADEMPLSQPPTCHGCSHPGRGFCRSEGACTRGVLMVGEAPGDHEYRAGLPFRPEGRAGNILERAIKRSGYAREEFGITDVVRCQPNAMERTRLESGVIAHCLAHLDQVVAEMRPKVILALGDVALGALTGMTGDNRAVSKLRGYVLDSSRYPDVRVVPAFHPNFLGRGGKSRDRETGAKTGGAAGKGGMHLFGVLCFDIKKAVEVAQHGHTFEQPRYIETPSLDEAHAFVRQVLADPTLTVAYDIETPDSATKDEEFLETAARGISQIQFSIAPGAGICFPWYGDFIALAKEILAAPNAKAGHNSRRFDNPILRAAGATLGGVLHDTMEMWQRLQPDLPAGLQFVASFFGFPFAWKHLAAVQPEFYGCCDADAAQRLVRALPEALKAIGAWRSYERHVLEFDPILVRMCERGIPVNDVRRQQFGKELEVKGGQLEAEIQGLVPDAVRDAHPRTGYKKDPKDTTGLVKRSFALAEGGKQVIVERWCKLEPFNSNSGPQILKYIRHQREAEIEEMIARGRTREWAESHAKHQVPINRKTAADTSSKLELARLAKATGDPFYLKVVERREIQKMISTYVNGYVPGPDGRIHSQFYHATGTGQLSSRNPNVQNIPKHGDLARRFRRMIEADPGHWLVEFDYKSAHALTLGFEAEDPDYMRIARIDMHSFLAAAGLLKLWTPEYLLGLNDADLAEKLAWVKKNHKHVRDKQAKPAILGYGFGMGAGTLLHNNPESFRTRAEAQKVIDTLNRLFPRTARFRNIIREKAHRDTRLISRFGYVRHFFSVMHWDHALGRIVPGDDSEACIAFLPANDAFGHIKESMLHLDKQGWNGRARLINQIHDALMFEIPDVLMDEAIPAIKAEMERKSEVLIDPVVAPDGLWIETSVSVGRNWGAMEELDPKTGWARKAA